MVLEEALPTTSLGEVGQVSVADCGASKGDAHDTGRRSQGKLLEKAQGAQNCNSCPQAVPCAGRSAACNTVFVPSQKSREAVITVDQKAASLGCS